VNATLARPLLGEGNVLWRTFSPSDVETVTALERISHVAPWTEANFRDALAAGYGMQVGVVGGTIVAYGVLLFAPGEAQLLNLTVAPEARRLGIGRALLWRFLTAARDGGAAQCFLEVRVSNVPAIALYEREGFLPVARRVGYYPAAGEGPREDAIVMRRALVRNGRG
jgi:ribosomal-protein-alanine N-acetyltransferase